MSDQPLDPPPPGETGVELTGFGAVVALRDALGSLGGRRYVPCGHCGGLHRIPAAWTTWCCAACGALTRRDQVQWE